MLNLLRNLFSLPTQQEARVLQSNVPNAVEHPLLAAFFDLREGQAYYIGTRRKKPARDFAPRLEQLILEFLTQVKHTGNATHLLNEFIFKSATAADTEKDQSNILSILKTVHPSGFKLIDPEPPVNFDTLKTYYRKAALKYHPDQGGSTKKMQKVNEAYATFHSVLASKSNTSPIAVVRSSPQQKDARDFIFYTLGLLLHIRTDLWDIDNALDAFYRLREIGALDDSLKFNLYKFYSNSNLLTDLEKLIKRLCVADRHDEAREVFTEYNNLYTSWLPDSTVYDKKMSVLKDHLEENKKTRVIMKHKTQVENAFINKVLNKYRYESYKEKFSALYKEEKEKKDKLVLYLKDDGFLNLVHKPAEVSPTYTTGLVPDPSLDGRIELLSPEQLGEYLQTFSESPSLGLVRKYELVRLTDLLRSYIAQEEHPVDDIYREIKLFEVLQPMNVRTSTPQLIRHLFDFLQYCESLAPHEKDTRLSLLRALDGETTRIRDWKRDRYGENCHLVLDVNDPAISVSLDGLIRLDRAYFNITRESFQSIRNRIHTLRRIELPDID